MNLKTYLENEKQKISALTTDQKIRYIAGYYWFWIAGFFLVLFFAVYLIHHVFFAVRDNWFYIVLTNIMTDEETVNAIRSDYADFTGYDPDIKNIVINAASYFDASVSGGTNNTYYQVFTAAAEAGDLDAAIMSEDNLKAVGASGILLDLSAEENAWIFEPYESLFVYTVPYDESYSTSPVPVGIDISSSLIAEKYHLYEDGCVFAVSSHFTHPEAVKAFLEFIQTGQKGEKP